MSLFKIIVPLLIVWGAVLSIHSVSYAASKDQANQADTNGFVEAVVIERKPPLYPQKSLRNYRAGIVELNFMVDKKGVVFAPFVVRSSHREFEKSALKAALGYQYEPATFNGVPVESRETIRIVFEIKDQKEQVSKEFASSNRLVKRELDKPKPNIEKIERGFKRMRDAYHVNSYSLAHLSLLEVAYNQKLGAKEDQIEAINRLFLFDDRLSEKGRLLDQAVVNKLQVELVKLELQSGYLNEALNDYRKLLKNDPAAAELFKPSIAKTRKILAKGEPFSRNVSLGDRGYQEVLLLESRFYLDKLAGNIEKIVFRCQKKYSEVAYKPDSDYKVPKSWGYCWIQIVGEPETTARLVQLK